MSMSDSERRLLADGRDDSDVGIPGRSRVAARRLARAVASSRGDPLVRESRARDSTRARRGATKAARGRVVALGRFVNDKAGYFPLLFYLAWVPYIVSLGVVPEGPFAHGLKGVPEWTRWAVSYAVNLWPYFSNFIVTATFWVLVVPVSAVVGVTLFANRREIAALARELTRRVDKARRRAKPGWAKRRFARAAAEAAAFPSTLAETLGQALVPGGWIHNAVVVVTEELVTYPLKVVTGMAEATRRVAKRLAASDFFGVARDVAWELAEFPAILAAATAPYVNELAPTLGTLAELFVGQAPLKGHEVPDLKAFARENRRENEYPYGGREGEGEGGFGADASDDAPGFGGGGMFEALGGFGGFARGVSRARVVSSRGVGGRLERVEEEAEGGEEEAEKSGRKKPDESDAERAPSRFALRAGGAV